MTAQRRRAVSMVVGAAPEPLKRAWRVLRSWIHRRRGTTIQGWDRPLVARDFAAAGLPDLAGTDGRTTVERPLFRADGVADSPAPRVAGPPAAGGDGSGTRCLLVASSVDGGGLDEFVAFLARHLPEHGFTVGVLNAPPRGDAGIGRIGRALQEQGIEVLAPAAQDGTDALDAWRPDVLSVHGGADWALEWANDRGIPVIETLHGFHTFTEVPRAAVVRRRELVDAFVAVSALVRQQYLAADPTCPPDRVVTVPNGVAKDRVPGVPRDLARQALGIDDEVLLVSLARQALQKNGYALVDSFADVVPLRPRARLLVCGRPDDVAFAARIARRADAKDLAGRVFVRDHSSRTDLLLAAADGFVLDSFFEGWALAPMEALASGVPVVVSDVGGAREQVEGRPHFGTLVPNPLGDDAEVTWRAMADARYRRQVNRSSLVDAIVAMVDREEGPAQRAARRSESLDVFRSDDCIRRHVEVLTAVLEHRPVRVDAHGQVI